MDCVSMYSYILMATGLVFLFAGEVVNKTKTTVINILKKKRK